jgi:hypothetical protein
MTDVSTNLQEILDVGLSPRVVGYLSNVTVGTFLDKIATNNSTSPFVAASIVAITPLIMLQDVSERTNTPIRCLLGDCNDRRRRQLQKMSKKQKCEVQYMRCQMRQTLMIV